MKRKAEDDPNPTSSTFKLKNIGKRSLSEDDRVEKHLTTRVSNSRPVHPKTAQHEAKEFTDLPDGRFTNESGEIFTKGKLKRI